MDLKAAFYIHRQRPGAAGFEDGTPAYLGISALKHGFAQIERFGSFPAVEGHTASLTRCHHLQLMISYVYCLD